MARTFQTSPDFKAAVMANGSAGTSGQVLVSGGSGTPPQWQTVFQRSSASITTSSSANSSGNVSLPKSAMLLSVYTDRAGWFRLYNSASASSADANRTRTTDPVAGFGVLLEVITVGAQTISLSPNPTVANQESPVSNSYSYRFTNDGAAGAATIIITYINLES